jgi:acyl-ACP thioesterase
MDAGGRASLQSICNYLQEIAGMNAAKLGFSVEAMFKHGLTWVLSRLHLQMHKYPRWGETIAVETWPSVMSGLFALREFIIRDARDDVIGLATTSWMTMDLKTKKAIEIPDFITSSRPQNTNRALEDNFRKLPEAPEYESELAFNVRRSDLDINQHVNNVNYIEWAIESIPVAYLREHYISALEISYRAEAHYGDRIISRCTVDESQLTVSHMLQRERDQRQVAVARTKLDPVQKRP